ncbi:MAG TPA: aminoglycoside 6'-N-acetyltransferase [Burkholderiaceae bacterium]|nr:aminoglycoside 6'-N-acetyltransferase [Burkholderiaceae bacterium]
MRQTRIEAPGGADDRRWLALRMRLWPHASEAQHLTEMGDVLGRGQCVFLAFAQADFAIGFAEASRRTDYVNGTESSPVGFLEGLYVEPSFRRNGIARALVAAVEHWASAQGCTELASDSLIENTDAHASHRALGFEETERVVYFKKRLEF